MANPIHLLNPIGGGAEYTAGDGISIQNDEISVKVDGSTVTVNGEGELVAHAPNELPEFSSSDANKVLKVDSQGEELVWDIDVGGYTAGSGIAIENNAISVNANGSGGIATDEGIYLKKGGNVVGTEEGVWLNHDYTLGENVATDPDTGEQRQYITVTNPVPNYTDSNAGQVLRVTNDPGISTALEWATVSTSLPTAAIDRRIDGSGYHQNTQEEQDATRGSSHSSWIAQVDFTFEVNTTDNINSTYTAGTPVKVEVWTTGNGTRTILMDEISLWSEQSTSYPNSTFYCGATGMHIYNWDSGSSMTSYTVKVYMPDGTQISFSPHGVVNMSVYRLGFYR